MTGNENTADKEISAGTATEERASVREAALDAMRSWYRDYHAIHGTTPVEDILRLRSRLDMGGAHPAGMSQFLVNKSVRLDSLFRDTASLTAGGRRLGRVLAERDENQKNNGAAFLSMSMGIATWAGSRRMPIVLYPIEVIPDENSSSLFRAKISISGNAELNEVFAAAMKNAGVRLEVNDILDSFEYSSVLEESARLYEAITQQVGDKLPDFAVERDIIIGNFIQTSTLVLNDAQSIINDEISGETGNTVLDALGGVEAARESLRQPDMPGFSPFDGDPHDEVGAGDVDNETRYAAQAANNGQSMTLLMSANTDAAENALAIATRVAMGGKTVLYAPGVSYQKQQFIHQAAVHGVDNLVADISDKGFNASIDRQLISAVGFQQGTAGSHFEQVSDELVGIRARLSRYLGDLHGTNAVWGVSAFETLENLARISALPMHPSTHVRLKPSAAHAMIGREEEWGKKLVRLGQLGGYIIGPDDTAWYGASPRSEDDAIKAYQRVVELLDTLLPRIREQIQRTVETCGFPIAHNVQEWSRQVAVLSNLRRVLDVFQPAVFERDIDSMLEAVRPKEGRKADSTDLSFWDRRRLTKEAKSLLRPGAHVDSLYDALAVVAEQAQQWRNFVPRGGWPVLPNKLDDIVEAQENLERDITALDAVLSGTPEGAGLESMEFVDLESRLRRLFDDHRALDTLPERTRLMDECSSLGLAELVEDFRSRQLEPQNAPAELLLSWWTTVFEDIVKSSPIISNQDGATLSSVTERFIQIDTEHVRSIGGMVSQELTRRLSEILYSRTQEANQLHTLLASRNSVGFERLHNEYGDIINAAKPIMVATAAALASSTPLKQLADVAVIDASAHTHPLEILSILARAKSVIVIAHENTVSSESVRELIHLLPSVESRTRGSSRDARDIRLSAFLRNNGYNNETPSLATDFARGQVAYHFVAANGMASTSTGAVESTGREVEAVADIVEKKSRELGHVPASYRLCIVCLTDTQRIRLGAELKSRTAGHSDLLNFVRHIQIITIDQIAGMRAADVILSVSFGKNSQGVLLQQFGALERPHADAMLLDALALAEHDLDIVTTFKASDMRDERIRRDGPLLLKRLLAWAQELSGSAEDIADYALPCEHSDDSEALLSDLARRIRQRGLNVSMNYGYNRGDRIPLVVGLPGKPYTLAVCTDDARFMDTASARVRHRFNIEKLEMLGWSVMYVWSVGMFVDPDKEVDRIVAYLANAYDGKYNDKNKENRKGNRASGSGKGPGSGSGTGSDGNPEREPGVSGRDISGDESSRHSGRSSGKQQRPGNGSSAAAHGKAS